MAAPGIDSKQAGLWVPPGAPYVATGAGPALTANRGLATRFVCPRSMTITKVSFFVITAATADDPCDVGIYDANGVRLSSSGSKSGLLNSTGAKQAALAAPVALIQGQVYYAAFACGAVGGTAANVQSSGVTGSSYLASMFGTTPPFLEWMFNSSYFPLPANFANAGNINQVPIYALL